MYHVILGKAKNLLCSNQHLLMPNGVPFYLDGAGATPPESALPVKPYKIS
jgi:hypothetical protein